jgi:ubiquinone biosynthesis protein
VIENLDCAVRQAAGDLFAALVCRDYGGMAAAMLDLMTPGTVDVIDLTSEVGSFVSAHIDVPLEDLDLREAITGILELAARTGLCLPEGLAELFKEVLYISGICRTLEPGFDIVDEVAPVIAIAREMQRAAA